MNSTLWKLLSCAFVVLLIDGVRAAPASCTAGQVSTSGVMQLKESSCLGSTDRNGLLALTGAAFKVDVNAKGIIYMTPIEQANFTWAGPGPYSLPTPTFPGFNWGNFYAREMNATGRYHASNKKVASVMFVYDVQGPYSRLAVTGANQITLVANHTVSYKSPAPNCTYNYTVVSGCVMGISASTPATCQPGWYEKLGRFGVRYCAPCAPGTGTTKPNSKKCTACKAGLYNDVYGGKCRKCEGSSFSTMVGSKQCDYCYISGWQYDPTAKPLFVDGVKGCRACPADSWAYDNNPSQCVACSKGVKCCRTSPSADCPKCPPGFKSSPTNTTTDFTLESAQPTSCYKASEALCTTSFKVTAMGTCQLVYSAYSRLAAESRAPCYTASQSVNFISGMKAGPKDFGVFGYYTSGTSNVSSIASPRITFQVNSQFSAPDSSTTTSLCLFTYRAIAASGGDFGVTPAPCPTGSKNCIFKASPPTCGKGLYVSANVDGNTLCLKCPPGTFSSAKSNTATSCKLCPAGTFATGYGNSGCRKCEAGTFSTKGSHQCDACGSVPYAEPITGYYSTVRGASSCTACPLNSYPQGNDLYPSKVARCLAVGAVDGSLCCAAGDCSGQPLCSGSLRPYVQPTGMAILQLKSSKLSDPACKYADFLTCMKPGSLMSFKSQFSATNARLKSYSQLRCVDTTVPYGVSRDLYGNVIATNRVRFIDYPAAAPGTTYIYEAVTSPATRTLTIYFAPQKDSLPAINPATSKCSASFTVKAGYLLDLSPPAGAKCPSGSYPYLNSKGLAIACDVCEAGSIASGGNCQQCPAGSYSPVDGATKCSVCPAGQQSYPGSVYCSTCYLGAVPDSAKSSCVECPVNTFATPGTQSCQACPQGTVAPKASGACGIPFPTS